MGVMRKGIVGTLFAVAMLAGGAPARADAASERWVRDFWPSAQAAGVSQRVYFDALSSFEPDPDILKRTTTQPEFVKPVWEYLAALVSEARIADGKKMLARYDAELRRIEARYGVDRHVLVAIWGIESNYGSVLNGTSQKSVIRSLATLAYAGAERSRFGGEQLIAALKILERGDVSPTGMVGSWAGAMGHTQFIPTTYELHAVDFDGDGKRNIWGTSPIDALASAANYLKVSGWVTGKTWGYEAVLPQNFDFKLVDGTRPLGEWKKLGLTRASGAAFPRLEDDARLMLPGGAKGVAFLALKNFSAIKRYNNSDSYVLAVGHLSDRIRGGDGFRQPWPVEERPLAVEDRAALQELLARKGFYQGDIDARLGDTSKAAIRAYQMAVGLPADGYPTSSLLQRLRRGG